VIVLPYHQPLPFAKAISTLDYLSGGRVRITIGVGHAEGEFRVLGVPYHERGRMTDEYLAALIELWTRDEPRFHGQYVDFENIAFEPKPTQQPYPPIWIGGNSRAAMRRAARHDGWSPWLITPDQLPECLNYIRSQPDFEARTRPFDVAMSVSTLQVSEHHQPLEGDLGRRRVLAGKEEVIDAIGHLKDLGVTWTSVPLPSTSVASYIEGLHWVAEEVMPHFR
jgi:probable F420-dependent oxidoreductase